MLRFAAPPAERGLGGQAICPRERTARPASGHRIYPNLLRDLLVDQPNQVWATDITHVPMARGWMYLVAIVDWYSRRVLSRRLSNTMETDFGVEAPEAALRLHGRSEIFDFDFSDSRRGHAGLSNQTPDEVSLGMNSGLAEAP